MAAARPKTRLHGWALIARDYEWLRAFEAGATAAEIARKWRVNARTVEKRLAAAREAEANARYEADAEPPWVGWIVPLFPIGAFTPQSTCAHKGEIKRGSYFYCPCEGCHKSGMDHRAALRRDPRTDPKPEPRPSAGPAKPPSATTRRERRAARRGAA